MVYPVNEPKQFLISLTQNPIFSNVFAYKGRHVSIKREQLCSPFNSQSTIYLKTSDNSQVDLVKSSISSFSLSRNPLIYAITSLNCSIVLLICIPPYKITIYLFFLLHIMVYIYTLAY